MTTTPGIDDLPQLSPGDVAALPVEQLAVLARDLKERRDRCQAGEIRLAAGLALKYGDRAQQARCAQGKDTGVIRLVDGAFAIVIDRAKRVAWDQAQLAALAQSIAAGGEDPADYIRTRYEVSESVYKAWPPHIRNAFEPARTVACGVPSFRIEPRSVEGA